MFLVISQNVASWILKYSQEIDKLNIKIIFNQDIELVPDTGSVQAKQKQGKVRLANIDPDDLEYYEDPDNGKIVESIREEIKANL